MAQNITKEIINNAEKYVDYTDRIILRDFPEERDKEEIIFRRALSNKVPGEKVSKEDWKQAEEELERRIEEGGESNPTFEIKGDRYSMTDSKIINEHLPGGIIYHIGQSGESLISDARNVRIMIGKIAEEKSNTDDIIIGREIVNNRSPVVGGVMSTDGVGFGRSQTLENLLWSRLYTIRGENLFDKDLPLHYNSQIDIDFARRGFEDLGLSRDEIKSGDESIRDKMHQLAIEDAKSTMAHERGHWVVMNNILSEEYYKSALNLCELHGERDLKVFLRGVYETLADTVIFDQFRGEIPYEIENDEVGLLYLSLCEPDEDSVRAEKLAQESEIIDSLEDYSQNKDRLSLKKSNRKVYERVKGYARDIYNAVNSDDTIFKLSKIKEDFDKNYR